MNAFRTTSKWAFKGEMPEMSPYVELSDALNMLPSTACGFMAEKIMKGENMSAQKSVLQKTFS